MRFKAIDQMACPGMDHLVWHDIPIVNYELMLTRLKQMIMNKILVGLLAGIAIGVLLAPDKGSETLRKLRSRINDYTDQAEDEADELADKAKSAINKGKKKVNETFE
jgi:hypothetical protein